MNKTISSSVKELRKESKLTALDFAKKYEISYSLLKNYESGKHDCPSLLVAHNFCKNFHITPEIFVSQYKLSDDPNFDKEDFLESLIYKLYGDNKHTKLGNALVIDKLNLKLIEDCKIINPSVFSVPISSILNNENKEKIAYCYFGYNKVRNGEDVLYVYRHLINSIQNILLMPLKDNEYNTKVNDIKNFLFATSSKKAFYEIYNRIAQLSYFKKGNYKSPINITILYQPSDLGLDFEYFCLFGKDFINKKQYYYKK